MIDSSTLPRSLVLPIRAWMIATTPKSEHRLGLTHNGVPAPNRRHRTKGEKSDTFECVFDLRDVDRFCVLVAQKPS